MARSSDTPVDTEQATDITEATEATDGTIDNTGNTGTVDVDGNDGDLQGQTCETSMNHDTSALIYNIILLFQVERRESGTQPTKTTVLSKMFG